MQSLRDTNGEVVEGHGGRIMRSTARKDRHSKINTAKGPRDRRVRLSAHTAIQFYDVQDRLGYDQPSKAVDWLIEKAKASIDALAESPLHNNFTATVSTTDITSPGEKEHELGEEYNQMDVQGGVDYDFEKIQYLNGGGGPITTSSISSHFQSYPPPDFDSRTVSHTQNFLPSSFKSLQDQNLLCFSSSPAYCFDKGVPDLGQLHRTSDWSPYSNVRNGEGTGVDFDSSEPVFGQSQSFSNRGTLQSNNMPSVCSPPMNVPAATANPPHQIMALNPSSVPNYEINSDKFYGFPFLA